jgi:hypothetical protein
MDIGTNKGFLKYPCLMQLGQASIGWNKTIAYIHGTHTNNNRWQHILGLD